MYTFITDEKIVVSNLVELNGDAITVHSIKAGHDLTIIGFEKSVKRLYGIICNEITAGKTIINLVDIKEHFCLTDIGI